MKPMLSFNSKLTATAFLALTTLAGCATMPTPRYVPTEKYQNYDCAYLGTEYNRLSQYIATTPRANPFTTSGIGLGMGIGRGGFYPSINMGVGTGATSNNNVGSAMGEQDAIIQAARYKQCGFAAGKKLYSEK